MHESSFNIGDIKIQYGITPVRDLLNMGYTVSDFEQITEEPTLANCNLYKNNQLIAILSFYNIKDKIASDQLVDIPIDLALPCHTSKNTKGKTLSPAQARENRIIWTVGIHLGAAAIFFCVYSFPAIFYWVQNTNFRARGGRLPIGMVLIILPALVITFIWSGVQLNQKPIVEKILLSFWLILNVIISLVYLVLIDNLFTHRFF